MGNTTNNKDTATTNKGKLQVIKTQQRKNNGNTTKNKDTATEEMKELQQIRMAVQRKNKGKHDKE